LDRAVELGDRLLPAFNATDSGLPLSLVTFDTGSAQPHSWTSGNLILADCGSLQIEFRFLSHASGDPKYARAAMKVRVCVLAW
jgi:Glycosyl hydrolase family 47